MVFSLTLFLLTGATMVLVGPTTAAGQSQTLFPLVIESGVGD